MVTGRINISNLGTGNVKDSPDSLSLDVKLGDNDIHLQLDKDPNFLPEVPVYILDIWCVSRFEKWSCVRC